MRRTARRIRPPGTCGTGICQMRLSHDPLKISASSGEANLVSRAGLVPVMGLAERAGLMGLVRVTIAAASGVNAEVKAGCLVAGMAAGAGSIDDMDVLRHGAMPVRALAR